jgi:hypothetical protein
MLVQPQPDLRQALKERGTLMLSESESLFTEKEWESIEALISPATLPYECVLVGDTGEPTHLDVGRFLTDVKSVQIVNHAATEQLLKIIASSHLHSFYCTLMNINSVYIRRAQVNRMHVGSFIGLHLDQESNPDYYASVTLQLGRRFEGGEFVVHRSGKTQTFIPTYRSIIISLCDIPHEVKKVTTGERVSLVYFLCNHAGENRRYASVPAHESPS